MGTCGQGQHRRGECREVTSCGWCQVGGHAEAVCWKRAAKCVKCGGQGHHGISAGKGDEGCTADRRTRRYALVAR